MTLEVFKQLINIELERSENIYHLRQNIEKIIDLYDMDNTQIIRIAHEKIARAKGKEYSPTVQELQAKIDEINGNKEQSATNSSQLEISDEEIDKMADEFIMQDDFHGSYELFVGACKMYRERLKTKQ